MASKFLENILTPYLRVCSDDSGILHECRIGQGLAGCDRDLGEERSLPETAGLRKTMKNVSQDAGHPHEIRTGHLPIASLTRYVCS